MWPALVEDDTVIVKGEAVTRRGVLVRLTVMTGVQIDTGTCNEEGRSGKVCSVLVCTVVD